MKPLVVKAIASGTDSERGRIAAIDASRENEPDGDVDLLVSVFAGMEQTGLTAHAALTRCHLSGLTSGAWAP